MHVMLTTLALAVATPSQPACRPQAALQTVQPADPALLYRDDGRARASRLGDLPKANHEKAVVRTINGCAAPVYVGYGVGR